MKLFGKLLIAVLIIGMLLSFTFLKGKDGKPLMNFNDLKIPDIALPDMPKLPDTGFGGSSRSGDKVLIYKWNDAEGNLQFSSSPPPEGIEYTVRGYDPNANVIQAVEVPVETAVEDSRLEEKEKMTSADETGNAYSPEKIEKLFESAKNVEKLLNDRIKNQEAIIGQ